MDSLFLNLNSPTVDAFGGSLDTSLCALAVDSDTPAHVALWLIRLAQPVTLARGQTVLLGAAERAC